MVNYSVKDVILYLQEIGNTQRGRNNNRSRKTNIEQREEQSCRLKDENIWMNFQL